MKRHLMSLHDFSCEKAEESVQHGFTLQPAAEAVVKKRPSKQVTDDDDSSDSEAPRGPRSRKGKTWGDPGSGFAEDGGNLFE